MKAHWNARKVVVVGAGAVGSTFAYALMQSGTADEIAITDANPDVARGQAMDLAHGLPFVPPVQVHEGTDEDYRDAQVVVVTAGAKQRPGESRLNLLQRNAGIVTDVVRRVEDAGSPAVILVVSNPVDVLTYVALKSSGLPRGRVIGSGTVLDSARFRYLLAAHCGVDVHNVHAYILGEHGDSEFAAWSMTHIAGQPVDTYCPRCRDCADPVAERSEIVRQVRESAYHIIGHKGATWFAVGLALVRIVEAILKNQRRILTVSTLLEGEYGQADVCTSVPCIVAGDGVERIVPGVLSETERAAFASSCDVLRGTLEQLRDAPPSAA